MDISFNNVLKGARQYFQGLPAATSSSGNQAQIPPSSQQQNDGSVHSEQHSAVPYWDQQNEGQGTNLTNRDIMNPPASTHGGQGYNYNNYPPPSSHVSTHQYQSHIPSNSAYYEVPQQKTSYVNVSNVQSNNNVTYSYQTPHSYANYVQTTSSSSQPQEIHYNYKLYNPQTSRNYQNYYPPTSIHQRSQQLPVVPTEIYHKKQHQQQQQTSQHSVTMVNPSHYQKPVIQSIPQGPSQRLQNGSSYSDQYKYYPNTIKYTQSSYSTSVATTTTTYSNQYLNNHQNYVDSRVNMQRSQQPTKYVIHETKSINQPQKMLPIPKQKRESPLDLSVKTVKTSADSTLGEYDERNYRAIQNHQYMLQQYNSVRAPKVEFVPNFNHTPHKEDPQKTKSYYNYSSSTSNAPIQALPRVEFPPLNKNISTDLQRKRPLDKLTTGVPEKMPKVDTWRQNIDKQIEQRLSSYTKSRLEEAAKTANGAPTKTIYNEVNYNKQHSNSYHYPSYPNIMQSHMRQKLIPPQHPQFPIQNIKQPAANKKVISLLRNSLQIKGAKEAQRKLEQEQLLRQNYREIQQPSTDVMAPLQPKPGIVGRRNVSPFTAASLERNSNTPPAYKLHIPKAIDSVIFSDSEKEQEASMGNQPTDLEGFAAFLASRIRTKAELKQVITSEQTPVNNNIAATTPPKKKECAPKKLFSERIDKQRTEVGGIRSSSETSVFDFPDSDNEAEMPVLQKQTLVEMRKDRKTVPTQFTGKIEDQENEIPDLTFDALFSKTCDNFMEQLKQGCGKKRGRRKRDEKIAIKTEPLEEIVPIKTEEIQILEEDKIIVQENIIEPTVKTEEENKTDESITIEPDTIKKELPEETQPQKDDSDSDTPLIICKQKIQSQKIKEEPPQEISSDSEFEGALKNVRVKKKKNPFDLKEPLPLGKPGKKPTFGDGSDFQPGWEEELYKYKKSLRMPRRLIQVTRPPNCQRLSTSLPDLDPCPVSPALSSADSERKPYIAESIDSDMDSNSSFNFSLTKNYDSEEGSSSIKSLNAKSNSILDRLLERYGGRKRRRHLKKNDDTTPKIIPKSENPIELLPTPSLEHSNKSILKSESVLLGFRKKTVDNFKGVFINNNKSIVGVGEFTTVVLKSRTRTETRVLKEKATIREVFGEDRPASAPPVTCLDEINEDSKSKENFFLPETKIKTEPPDDDLEIKKEICSNDGETIKKRSKLRNIRRKFSSGFDYIRKKKKQIKKEDSESNDAIKIKKRSILAKATPESVQDIQKEIKTWVLNKGVGETHLHRASRSGFTDIAAYCLEKMTCNPSPKDNAGYTPLHEACSKGHLDIARLLLQYGAHVSESAQGGIRPLHEAAENGFVEIVRLLLSYGADPTLATYSGITPLQLAVDDTTVTLLKDHLDELQGKSTTPWQFNGPAVCFDAIDVGFNPLADIPNADILPEENDIEMEISEQLLPNLYILPDSIADRWLLLQDLSNILKIKSKETLIRQLSAAASNSSRSDVIKELKMVDFLEQARCCQFLNANEKLNTRATKIFLVKYTEKVKELLNIENIIINVR